VVEYLDRPHRDYKLERLITLSDGVFAIALTLLALELRPPAQWNGDLASLWTAMRGSVLAFAISFLVIGGYWASHRRNFAAIVKADGPLTALGLLGLGLVTLLPVGTRLLIEHGRAWGALAVYLGLIAAIGVVNALTWGYAALAKGVMAPATPKRVRIGQFVILLTAPFIACLICLLALGGAGLWFWAAVAVLIVAQGRFRRWALHGDAKAAPASPPAKTPARSGPKRAARP
jgi:uncharacterized membrane protein